jgi:hypothetical protein
VSFLQEGPDYLGKAKAKGIGQGSEVALLYFTVAARRPTSSFNRLRQNLGPSCDQVAIMSTIVTVTQQPAITAENVLRLFPEVNTALIGGSHNSATSDNALQGYDEEQIRLMDEVCIVLDDNDIPIGSATKKLCSYKQGGARQHEPGVSKIASLTLYRPSYGKH